MIVRKAESSDFDLFYKLKCDPVNIYWTGHLQAPEKNKLKIWFDSIRLNTKKHIFIATDVYNNALGYSYIDIVDNDTIESSVGVLFEQKGKGYATKLICNSLSLFLNTNKQYTKCLAWIAQDNIGSIKAYENNGFVLSLNKKEILFPDNTIKIFNCYMLKLG